MNKISFVLPVKRIEWCTGLSVGSDSAVVIVTRYGLDGPGIESPWGRNFPRVSRAAVGPPRLL